MPEIFTIGFSEDAFASAVAGELATPGITPLAATSRFFVGSLLDGLTMTMGPRLIKDPAVSRGTWPARYETLENLASGGAEVWPRTSLRDPARGRRGRRGRETVRLPTRADSLRVRGRAILSTEGSQTQNTGQPRTSPEPRRASRWAVRWRRGQAEERAPAVLALHRQSGAAWFRPADRYLPAPLPHGLLRPRSERYSAVLRMRPDGPRTDVSRGDRTRRRVRA